MRHFGLSPKAKPLVHEAQSGRYHIKERHEPSDNGIRAYTQPKVWPTNTLGPKRRSDYDNHQYL